MFFFYDMNIKVIFNNIAVIWVPQKSHSFNLLGFLYARVIVAFFGNKRPGNHKLNTDVFIHFFTKSTRLKNIAKHYIC